MGGMGFNYKWNMSWLNDMLYYVRLDPIYRKWNHDKVTLSPFYAFSENYILALSHDEVVQGKRSLIGKMSGDYREKIAGLRSFYGYWMGHPGKKLIFMGGEFGQLSEWKEEASLEWELVEKYDMHKRLQEYTRALNKIYVGNKPLWEVDFDRNGFQWIESNDNLNSIVSFMRKAEDSEDYLIIISNFTANTKEGYRIGVPETGAYEEVLNSDATEWGGKGITNSKLTTEEVPYHNRSQSIRLKIPPLATIYLKHVAGANKQEGTE